MSSEADTCRKQVVPKLQATGWDTEPHAINEQRTFTDGRIVVTGNRVFRQRQKRADFILRYTRDFAIAVVEAKADFKLPGDGLQQAREYAQMLGLKFAQWFGAGRDASPISGKSGRFPDIGRVSQLPQIAFLNRLSDFPGV